MNESKTPETDAVTFIATPESEDLLPLYDCVEASFAKQLEISRNAWRECAQRLADIAHYPECVCSGFTEGYKCTRCKALQQFTELSKQ